MEEPAMAKVGVEWVNNYDWTGQLTYEDQDAGGCYDELVNHAGWIGAFNWGNSAAWEDDFKRNDKNGSANAWADSVDLCYFTGHGSPWGFYFRSDVPDDNTIESDYSSGPDNGDLRIGKYNLEWLALEVCNTLQMDASSGGTNYDVFDRWAKAFQGLHTICSFTTTSWDVPTPGRYFAAFLDGRWPSLVFGLPSWMFPSIPYRVIDSWFLMAEICQNDDSVEAAVMYANTAGTDTGNDYIWGYGAVSSDPVPGAANWFSWTWVPHQC
jgi:uncharacterized protein DUF6345